MDPVKACEEMQEHEDMQDIQPESQEDQLDVHPEPQEDQPDVQPEPQEDQPDLQPEPQEDQPDLQPEPQEDQPDLQPEPQEDQPDLQPEPQEDQPDLQPEPQEDQPDLQPEPQEDQPDLQPEPQEDQPDFQPEPQEDQPDLQPEPQEDQPDLQPEPQEDHLDVQPESQPNESAAPSDTLGDFPRLMVHPGTRQELMICKRQLGHYESLLVLMENTCENQECQRLARTQEELKELDSLRKQLDDCKLENGTLVSSLEEQQKAVDSLKDERELLKTIGFDLLSYLWEYRDNIHDARRRIFRQENIIAKLGTIAGQIKSAFAQEKQAKERCKKALKELHEKTYAILRQEQSSIQSELTRLRSDFALAMRIYSVHLNTIDGNIAHIKSMLMQVRNKLQETFQTMHSLRDRREQQAELEHPLGQAAESDMKDESLRDDTMIAQANLEEFVKKVVIADSLEDAKKLCQKDHEEDIQHLAEEKPLSTSDELSEGKHESHEAVSEVTILSEHGMDSEGVSGTDSEGSSGTHSEGSSGTDSDSSCGTDSESSSETESEGSHETQKTME